MRMACSWLTVLALACTSGADDTATTDPGPLTFEDFVNTDVVAKGDFSCFTPGEAWLAQTVDAAKVQTLTIDNVVEDFQSDVPVPEATLQVWFDDVPGGPPDASDVSGQDGEVSLQVQTCSPLAYKTATEPTLEATIDTFEMHEVVGADGSFEPFTSVSTTTYKLIPTVLGLQVAEGRAVIAGTAFDCNRDEIEGAQVIVKDRATGDISQEAFVRYFVNDFPNQQQPTTSADGLWNAIDVTDGEWAVELWIWDGTAHVLVGATWVDIVPDSINVTNIHTGYGDGVKLPDSCLATDR
jgi:hypothetical protein